MVNFETGVLPKIYEVRAAIIDYGKYRGYAKYISGFTTISEINHKNKTVFCDNLGYWISWNDIYETDLEQLPEEYYWEGNLSTKQRENILNRTVSFEQLKHYDYKEALEKIINNTIVIKEIDSLIKESHILGFKTNTQVINAILDARYPLPNLSKLNSVYNEFTNNEICSYPFLYFIAVLIRKREDSILNS